MMQYVLQFNLTAYYMQLHQTASFLYYPSFPLLLYYHSLILATHVLYDIYLRATTTTTTSIRGVQIPIGLRSSATDSF